MKKGRVLVVVTLVSIFLLFFSALRDQPADPSFEGKLASHWCQELLSPDYSIRDNARAALKSLGARSVPQLRLLLRQRSVPWEKPLVRLNALFPLLNYRPVNATASRIAASDMLGSLGEDATSAVPDLVAALAFDSSAAESERALVRIGSKSLPHLESALSSKNDLVRARATRLVREVPAEGETTVVALLAATRDRSPVVRKETVLSLAAGLARGKWHDRLQEQVCAALVSAARDKSSDVRAAAMFGLGTVDAADARILSALATGLSDSDATVALESAKSLWAHRCSLNEVVSVLISILETPERWRAAYALSDMGTNAASAAPALSRLLEQERVPRPFRTPPSSAFALGKIGASAIPEVASLLESSDPGVRMNALMAFSFMGKKASAAVPELLKVLSDKNPEVRHTAALTLASIGAEPEQIIAGLSDCLRAEDIYMRSAAAAHLREIAPNQTWLIPGE